MKQSIELKPFNNIEEILTKAENDFNYGIELIQKIRTSLKEIITFLGFIVDPPEKPKSEQKDSIPLSPAPKKSTVTQKKEKRKPCILEALQQGPGTGKEILSRIECLTSQKVTAKDYNNWLNCMDSLTKSKYPQIVTFKNEKGVKIYELESSRQALVQENKCD